MHTVKSIMHYEGRLALFKGVSFSFVTNMIIGLFFMVNERTKKRLQRNEFFEHHPGVRAFTSAFGVSFLFSIVATPLYVIKTWKLLETNQKNITPSAFKMIGDIKRTHGRSGFYRGFLAMNIMGLNGTITVGLNDYFKLYFPLQYETLMGNFLLGGTARLIASTILYPVSTIRTRMMQNQMFEGLSEPKYKTFRECIIKTYNQEGYSGFYKGYLAGSVRAFLSSALLFTTYERVFKYLKANKNVH